MNKSKSGTRMRGWSLLEIVLVTTIIGLFVTLAIPGFQQVMTRVQNNRFKADLRIIEGSLQTYTFSSGVWPDESSDAEAPEGLEEYIHEIIWQTDTAIGGKWDWDRDSFGFKAGISCKGFVIPLSQLSTIDEDIDDGDLSSGMFRLTASNRVTRILDDEDS